MFGIEKAKIIGIGESCHGSAIEFAFKVKVITDYLQDHPDVQVILFFEAYVEQCQKINEILHQPPSPVSKKNLAKVFKEIYKVWQCKVIWNMFLDLQKLIFNEKVDLEVVGVDYVNKDEKLKNITNQVTEKRDKLMAENIKKNYDKDRVHFLWAHNMHCGRYSKTSSELVPINTTGYYLDQFFHNNYINIAQAFIKGGILSRSMVNKQLGGWRTFDIDTPIHEDSIEKFFAEKVFSSKNLPLVIEDLPTNVKRIRNIGYYCIPEDVDKQVVPLYEDTFDYYVLHKNSEPNKRLE